MTSLRSIFAVLAWAGAAHAQTVVTCPRPLDVAARCYEGRDASGAAFAIAIPEKWNRALVIYGHGGPSLRAPDPERVRQSLDRWSFVVKAGYAWAGTSYARGGYGVRSAAEDLERLRGVFVAAFGAPRRALLHGEGWGANVAARALELFPGRFDGALLTSGEIAGATRAYDARIDLRAVYQYFCRNHPRPDEPPYPLWMGEPPGVRMNSADVRERVNACTGWNRPAPRRTSAQRRALAEILAATRIPERSLVNYLTWSTGVLADIVRALDGRNPFTNVGVAYHGTTDDRALDAGVPRFAADPLARARLAADGDPTGRADTPTVTLHAVGDPVAYVEQESAYRETRERAGTAGRLVQLFTDERDHDLLATPELAAALAALDEWVEQGRKPTAASVIAGCAAIEAQFRNETCRILADYRPRQLETRVPPRIAPPSPGGDVPPL